MAIQRVAVIGAGVMGAAIAAHVANAGVPVLLLDIVPEGANNRNALADGAVAAMLKNKPAPFTHRRNARLIATGNLDDDLDKIADCDWICEAIIENPKIKHDLYLRLDKARKAGSIVSSNTSTIPLNDLIAGQSEQFAQDFAITHFFNPPRYMRLLELVGGPATRADALNALRRFGDVALGKEVVDCRDTAGFIANRIGIYWSAVAMRLAYDMDLTVEQADSIVGQPMGIPKTGIFGLADLTGIDLGPHVIASMLRLLPADDALCRDYQADHSLNKLTERMIADGYTGRKGKGGFYRRQKVDGKTVREVLDLKTGDYRPTERANLQSARAGRKGLRAVVEYDDAGGRYAWGVAARVLAYTASLVPEIGDDIYAIDQAMKTGYAWKWGPFEQIDQLGTGWLAERLAEEGMAVPALLTAAAGRPLFKEEDGRRFRMTPVGDYAEIAVADDAWMLADKKRGAKPIAGNASASIWDVGDGVACLELHSKMNAIDDQTIAMVRRAADLHKKDYKALIIGCDADNFSVGANIGLALFAANTAMWPIIENMIGEGQKAMLALRYGPMPVVAAVAGMALGGGLELALHSDAVQAHAESYMGLVEVGVGVIPGFGGCKEMVVRHITNKKRPGGPMPALAQAFEAISTAKVATSAAEARDLLYLRDGDAITMNRQRLLADAKAKALAMVADYVPPELPEVFLPGATARAAMAMVVDGFVDQGKATAYDAIVAKELGQVLSGGDTDITEPVTEKALLKLERESFVKLLHNGATLDRIEHMLTTGRPLRN